MEFSIYSFFYLFVVLAPFIIISAIAMISLFDVGTTGIKGFLFLVGLPITLIATSLISKPFGQMFPSAIILPENKSAVCIATSMAYGGAQYIIPMGQVIISYTFWYLTYCIIKNDSAVANVGLILFFSLLILSEIAWNYYHNCFGLLNSFVAFIIGGAMGATYASIVDYSSGGKSLYSFSGTSRADSCSVPSKQKFKCSVSEGGRAFQ